MTITIDEKWESGGLDLFSASFSTILRGTDDYKTALLEAASVIPEQWSNGINQLYLTNIGKIERLAEEVWRVPFEYGSAQAAQQEQQNFASESDFSRSFEIGGGTARITHSLATINEYVPAGAATTDFKQAINVTDTAVEGTDIIIPSGTFSETRNFTAAQYDALVAILKTLVGKVNSTSFLNFSAGEVLYLGASGGLKGSEFGEVSHKFSYSQNVTGHSIGSITGIAKKGHEFLWIRSKEEVDAASKRIMLTPSQVNVEQVYRTADLNNIPNINNY